jgi:predicted  nucleic acid-binding Zn-ribbon protein
MSVAKRVYDLQQIELSIQDHIKQLEAMDLRIRHNEQFAQAEAALKTAENERAELEKQYKELDAEAEALRAQLGQIQGKLYGGKIKNPKELMGFEQEASMIKSGLDKKDDVLLDMMEKLETGKVGIKKLKDVCKIAAEAWQSEKSELKGQVEKVKVELSELEKRHGELLTSIDKDTIATYEAVKGRKGQAVVKVEQGRCLGCRVTLSVSEMQHARGNAIVTCGNCGRILYLS